MNRNNITVARRLAREFITLADELLKSAPSFVGQTYISGTKLSGATRRKSLDLTRALAEMRKS